jgi:hypothetical protein
MRLHRNTIVAAVAVLFATAAGVARAAEEFGQIPYSVFYQAFTRSQKINSAHLRPTVTVVSTKAKDAGAPPVKLVIQAKAGPINVTADSEGEIRSFPLTEELRKENPEVLSNQPRGTSQLRVAVALVLPDTLTYSYRLLAERLEEANREMKKQAGMLSIMLPRAKTLEFHFSSPGKQTVTVAATKPQTFTTDNNGNVQLVIDSQLAAEDPQVIVSVKPEKVTVK